MRKRKARELKCATPLQRQIVDAAALRGWTRADLARAGNLRPEHLYRAMESRGTSIGCLAGMARALGLMLVRTKIPGN